MIDILSRFDGRLVGDGALPIGEGDRVGVHRSRNRLKEGIIIGRIAGIRSHLELVGVAGAQEIPLLPPCQHGSCIRPGEQFKTPLQGVKDHTDMVKRTIYGDSIQRLHPLPGEAGALAGGFGGNHRLENPAQLC